MADISRDQSLRIFAGRSPLVETIVLDNSVAQTLFRGVAVILDANVDANFGRIFDSGVTLASGDTFLGIAAEGKVVLTTDTEGDNKITFFGHDAILGFLMSQFGTFTNANLGEDIHLSDSGTLTTTLGTNLKIGVVHAIEDGYVYVRLEAPFDVA